MEAQIRIGARREFVLKRALLIYGDESSAFATLHEVRAEKGKTPYLGPGQSLTTAFLRALARGLGARTAPEIHPENVLARTPDLLVWWSKAQRRVMFFEGGSEEAKRLNGRMYPHPGLVFNVHLDGMEKNHDLAVEREGVFKAAIEGIKIAKAAGFRVFTNTTVYRETDMKEIWELFEYLEPLKVDGHTIAPAYGYTSVNDQDLFMTRDDIHEKFKDVDKMSKRFPLVTSPVYQEFLQGSRELPCTAWGNPTYNVKGWKGPCYMITDMHFETFEQFMTQTPWESYGQGNDPRCEHCMMHCGYEPSAAYGINAKFSDPFKTLSWLIG